jgi:NAD(P)-dependent dehydrogenase (short-subunit alcohol dehydrogenase family)
VNDFLQNLFGLAGQTAVVIGGTGVLGGALCEGLARAGANVVVAGRGTERGQSCAAAIQAGGGRAVAADVDVLSRVSLEALLDCAMREFGRADVLVNCAGVNSATPYLEITDEEWDKILAVNQRGVHLACQVFGRRMIEGGQGGSHGGSIINIGSVSADIPLSRVFAYSASKAGVVNLTRNLAREWGAQGVRVNAICPGFFPAEQNRKILDQKRTDDVIGHTPAGRFGRPEELVGPLLLLASRTAGSFITGAVLYVDGGFTAMTI